MSAEQLEEIEGFIEAWLDDAANERALAHSQRAEVYDECAAELREFLGR